jgi:hypothetical protein
VGAVADRLDGRLGRADQPDDLGILHFRMVAQQPEDGVRPILALRHRRVARRALLRLRDAHLRNGEIQLVRRILLRALDLVARELAGLDRIEALDALRRIAVGDRLHFKRVQLAECGDLLEGQRRVVDQPDRGRLGHERSILPERHIISSCSLPRPAPRKPSSTECRGVYPEI